MTHESHSWFPDGNQDDGSKRYRCTACRCTKTWPEAHARCGVILADSAPRPTNKKHKQRASSIVEGAPPNRECKVCAKPYHSKHHGSRYCSQPCAKVAWDRQHAASQSRVKETPEQREARAARQRQRKRDEAALVAAEAGKADDAATGRQEAAE